jgi:2-C-methyl-D-erythritol 2,4-cyclodiphosphate synthase
MQRVGTGFDAHRLVAGRALVLGGESIPFDKGLEGHSDGDALLHALTDAVLGAVGAADIGALFPPGDARFKDAPSRLFLERAVGVAAERGYRVAQVDAVVIAEAPKLRPHVDRIRKRIAEILELPIDAVGLKATTTDGMGFTGRGEGIAVSAVATLLPLAGASG